MESTTETSCAAGRSPSFLPVRRMLLLCCRLLLAGVFIHAGATKIVDPGAFSEVIAAYGMAPPWLVLPLAVLLPVLELLAGVGLVLGLPGSLAVLTVLTLFFMAVLWQGLRMGLDIDCGCYAPGDPMAEAFHGLRAALWRDVGLLALCGACFWLQRTAGAVPPLWPWRKHILKPEKKE